MSKKASGPKGSNKKAQPQAAKKSNTQRHAKQSHDVSYALSSLRRRFVAKLIDLAILLLMVLPFWLLASLFGDSFVSSTQSGVVVGGDAAREQLVFSRWFYVANFLQFAFLLAQAVVQARTGYTVGKRIVHVKLLRLTDAQPIGLMTGAVRSLMKTFVFFTVFLWPFNYLWMGFDRKRQSVIDKLVRAVVVDA